MQYREQTVKYMEDVRNYLTQKFGEVKSEWEMALDMLASTLEQYFQCCDEIEQNGVVVPGQRGIMVNPACTVKNQCQIRLEKIIAEFGLASKSAMKLTVDVDDTDSFIEDLVQ